MTEDRFKSWDGTELFYRAWTPEITGKKAMIIIHRGHEHSGRVEKQVEELGLKDFWAFSWDNRGHGNSPGERGHADSYYDLVKDLNAFANHICGKHSLRMEDIVLVANSVGAVTASTWVHDFAPRVRALVMAAPAFRIKLYVPFAVPGLRLLQRFKGKATISSYVKSKMLTHDLDEARKYDNDELITRDIAVNVLLGLHDTATRIMEDAGAITTPTLVLSAGSDWVVKISAQRKFFQRLSSPKKEMEVYPGFYHALLYEKESSRPIARAREFILEAFDEDVDRNSLINADKGGYTRTEYDLLRQPTGFSKTIYFWFQRFFLRTVGRLSEGVRLGWSTGFDSGKSLDYVYENTPRGITALGRIIDKFYLDAIGWRGIRVRGKNIEQALLRTIEKVADDKESVRVMDIAAGCGRYVLNALKEIPDSQVSALLRDYDPGNVEAARIQAEAMDVENVDCQQGDAFDASSIMAVNPKPDIAIVSGLYELFQDNRQVQDSLKGLAGAIEPGGYLIYTGQPWHPQVEMIARTLSNRDGESWIMRRRSQAEMDELVRVAGFEKLEMEIDEWGIFTVSIARRVKN